MNKFWSSRLEGVEPYTPGEQPKGRKFIKLNTNENPYPPSPEAARAIMQTDTASLRLYPDPECESLRQAVAEIEGLSADEVFVGNGSDEVLAFSFMAFFSEGSEIIFPDITYSFYPVYADILGIKYRQIPLNDDFTIPLQQLSAPNAGVVFANPNAPTGLFMPLSDVESVLKANPDHVVIVDEAYYAFGNESAVSLIRRYPNLLVVRTMSKSHSLAGMRVGFALGDKGLITALNCVKNSINSYTIDRVALTAAEAAVRDDDYMRSNAAKIVATRTRVTVKLREMGFSVPESGSNFIFIKHEKKAAPEMFAALRERGILVRYFAKPRIDDRLRVTIGTDEEMDEFLKQMADIIS